MLIFHWYGLIVGLAVVLGWFLLEKQAARHRVSLDLINPLLGWAVVGGLIGARLWHVATDWQLYQDQWLNTFKIWQGGLSILGAVAGGLVAVWLAKKLVRRQTVSWQVLLDVLALSLPFAQALGRLGNWVNQELYGLPTDLPWGLDIDPEHRVSEYQAATRFHPLFAYEMLATLSFGLAAWWWDRRRPSHFGQGRYFLVYALYYAAVRFVLDSLRIEKNLVGPTGLGINQIILLGVGLISACLLLRNLRKS